MFWTLILLISSAPSILGWGYMGDDYKMDAIMNEEKEEFFKFMQHIEMMKAKKQQFHELLQHFQEMHEKKEMFENFMARVSRIDEMVHKVMEFKSFMEKMMWMKTKMDQFKAFVEHIKELKEQREKCEEYLRYLNLMKEMREEKEKMEEFLQHVKMMQEKVERIQKIVNFVKAMKEMKEKQEAEEKEKNEKFFRMMMWMALSKEQQQEQINKRSVDAQREEREWLLKMMWYMKMMKHQTEGHWTPSDMEEFTKYKKIRAKQESVEEIQKLMKNIDEKKKWLGYHVTTELLKLCECKDGSTQTTRFFSLGMPCNDDPMSSPEHMAAMRMYETGDMVGLQQKIKSMSKNQVKSIFFHGLIKSICDGASTFIMHTQKFELTYMN